MELGVCGADVIGGVGGCNTPVYVNVCLNAADGLCLHNAQATWRASTALRSVDGDTEIMRTCFDMGKNRVMVGQCNVVKYTKKGGVSGFGHSSTPGSPF